MLANLKHAAWSREGATIAKGIFTPEECAEAARKLEAFDDMLAALEWIAARLERGGKAAASDAVSQARAAIAKARGDEETARLRLIRDCHDTSDVII